MPAQAPYSQGHLAYGAARAACALTSYLQCETTQAGLFRLCLRTHAQAFTQLNQAEGHHTHDGDGGKQPLRTLPLQSFRLKPCFDRLVICLDHPACGIWQSTCTRLRKVCDIGITQQDPFQPVPNVWGCCFPDAHDGTCKRGVSAPPVARSPGGTPRHGSGTHAQVRRACRMVWPLAYLSRKLSQGDCATCRGTSAPGALPSLWMTQRAVFGCTDHKTMAQFLTTHPVCVDVRVAVGAPDPRLLPMSMLDIDDGFLPTRVLAIQPVAPDGPPSHAEQGLLIAVSPLCLCQGIVMWFYQYDL